MKNTAEVCLAAGGAKHPKSGFMLMEKLDTGKQAVPLADAVVRLIRESGLPVRSITTDNGPEFAAHEIIARELNTKVYFAHPYCTWEKGAFAQSCVARSRSHKIAPHRRSCSCPRPETDRRGYDLSRVNVHSAQTGGCHGTQQKEADRKSHLVHGESGYQVNISSKISPCCLIHREIFL